jgi:peptidoglycan DL-endopeptidase CwlO
LALKRADRTLAALRAQSGDAQKILDGYRGDLGRRAAYAYMYGPGLEMSMFLDTDDPDAAAERVQLLDFLSRRDLSLIDGVRASQSTVSDLLSQAERARQVRSRELARIEDKKAEVEKKVAETERVLARLRAEERARNVAAPTTTTAPPTTTTRPPTTTTAPPTTTTRPPTTSPSPAPSTSSKGAIAVNYARAQLGKPYEWGADGPDSFDCSGLTMMAWRAAGVTLSHSSRAQYAETRRVAKADLVPGDLIFRGYNGTISHVSIYIGGGQSITAPQTGDVVKIQDAFTTRDIGYTRPS